MCPRAQALAKVQHIYRVLRRNYRGGKVLVVKTGSALTFVAGGYPQRFIQVVLKLFPSPTDVLTSFDVDVCGFAYDGTAVRCTHRALRAATTRCNLVDLDRRSKTYESRLLKYAKRGYSIGFSEELLDRSRLDPSLFDATTLLTSGKLPRDGLSRLLLAEQLDLRKHSTGLPSLGPSWRHDAIKPSNVPEGPPITILDAWARGWFGGRIERNVMLPFDPTVTWHKGNQSVSANEVFMMDEADQMAGDSATGIRPVLYSAGVIPWRVGCAYRCDRPPPHCFPERPPSSPLLPSKCRPHSTRASYCSPTCAGDCQRLEAYLRTTFDCGENWSNYHEDMGDVPAETQPAANARFTLTTQRFNSMVPSEHVVDWGYKLECLLFESSFSLAERNSSFFPVPPAGFSKGCHVPPSVTTLTELVFKASSTPKSSPIRRARTAIDFYRAVKGVTTFAEAAELFTADTAENTALALRFEKLAALDARRVRRERQSRSILRLGEVVAVNVAKAGSRAADWRRGRIVRVATFPTPKKLAEHPAYKPSAPANKVLVSLCGSDVGVPTTSQRRAYMSTMPEPPQPPRGLPSVAPESKSGAPTSSIPATALHLTDWYVALEGGRHVKSRARIMGKSLGRQEEPLFVTGRVSTNELRCLRPPSAPRPHTITCVLHGPMRADLAPLLAAETSAAFAHGFPDDWQEQILREVADSRARGRGVGAESQEAVEEAEAATAGTDGSGQDRFGLDGQDRAQVGACAGGYVHSVEIEGSDEVARGLADGELIEMDDQREYKVRRLLPLLEICNKLADAELLPKPRQAGAQSHCYYVSQPDLFNHYNLKSMWPALIKRGLVLRAALTPREVTIAEGVIASLKQDADLSAICDIDTELRLLPYTFPHSAIDGNDGGDDARDGTVGFLVGETVLLTGLAKAPQFNGRKGTILGGYAGGRYPVEVQLLSGETKHIKIKRAPHTSFPCAIPCMNGSTPLTAIATVHVCAARAPRSSQSPTCSAMSSPNSSQRLKRSARRASLAIAARRAR